MTHELILEEPTYDPATGEWIVRLILGDTGKLLATTDPRKSRKAALHSAKELAQTLLRKKEAAFAGAAR